MKTKSENALREAFFLSACEIPVCFGMQLLSCVCAHHNNTVFQYTKC